MHAIHRNSNGMFSAKFIVSFIMTKIYDVASIYLSIQHSHKMYNEALFLLYSIRGYGYMEYLGKKLYGYGIFVRKFYGQKRFADLKHKNVFF